MPTVPYSPVPGVTPSTSSPADYENIQASPQDFGAQIGQSVQKLGGTLEQGGAETIGTAQQYQIRANNVASDAAFNQHQTNVNNILYGDPNHPETPGYYGLHGQAALDARPVVQQALEDSRKNLAAGLNSAAALTFDEASRRINMNSMNGVGSHYDQEFTRYTIETQNAGIAIKARDIANNWNNEDNFQHNLADGLRAADAISANTTGHLAPGSQAEQDIFNNNRATISQSYYRSRAVAMGSAPADSGGGPVAALAFIQKNSSQFDAATLRTLTDEFKSGADAATVATGISNAMTPGGGAPTSATADQLTRAITAQEGPRTSIQGAVAGVMPATFKQYARPGESIANPADVAAVRGRIIADLAQKTNGDPARVAVGFFSGPGNIAPPGSPTPWINDAKDANGKSTSSYVTDVVQRLSQGGGAAASGSPPIPQSGAREAAISPRYMDEINMIQRAYAQTQPMMATNPALALKIRNGVMEQIQKENAFENGAQDRASRDMGNHQRDNEAILFGTAVAGQPIAESDLANYLKTQQITPSGYTAIKAVQQRQAEGQDEPKTVAALWDGVGNGSVSSQDVYTGIMQGLVKGTTGNEMIKALSARAKVQTSAVERGDYENLKTALGGHLVENGQMDFFGTGKVAAAQLWTQAQAEWNKRVISGTEKPDDVLADMMPRYQKAIPDKPAAWPNPRFGMVKETADVGIVAQKTKAAFDAGQINQDTYQSEGDLLARYLSYFQQEDARLAAAKKLPKGTSRPTALTPGNE